MKKKQHRQRSREQEDDSLTVSDALDDSILAKLKIAKQQLTVVEKEQELERQAQIRREREEREKNKSFEELLEEYGDKGFKY